MTEQERDLGQRFFEEVWNRRRREAIAEFISPEAVLHEAGSDAVGPDGFYPFFDRLSAALSEIRMKVEETMADGDKVCVRWSCAAKHTGEGLGVSPTGVAIHVTGITIMRVAGGKLIEAWQNWDMLGLMEQIQGSHRAATYVSAPPHISAINAV
jgi:predicted ester cyclase